MKSRTTRQRRKRGMWLQRVNRILKDLYPFCPVCEAAGVLRLATETDHKVPLEQGGEDTIENMQRLCKEHHAIKTAKERGYEYKPKPRIGADGWPIA